MPKAPDGQKIYEIYKPEGSPTFHARIKIGQGEQSYSEDFDTEARTLAKATPIANGRVRRLYREKGIESPQGYKRRTGCPFSIWQIRRWTADGTLASREANYKKQGGWPPAEPKRKPHAPAVEVEEEEAPARNGTADWREDRVRIENKFAQAFQRILSVCLLGVGDDDPQTFRDHVRAIVTETTLAGLTPTGRLKRKF